MLARLSLCVLACLIAAACATDPRRTGPSTGTGPMASGPERLAEPQTDVPLEQPGYLKPRHLNGMTPTRVGLLLPLTSENSGTRRVAEGLRDAAQLALFEVKKQELLLILKDTKGTPEGAMAAAQAALNEGAEVILGPLFAETVRAASRVTRPRGVPIVAFSSDRTAAAPDTFLLSFQVEEEIRRVVSFTASEGIAAYAALVPDSQYGERVAEAFEQEVEAQGGMIQKLVEYSPYTTDFTAPVKRIADFATRKQALDAQREQLMQRDDMAAQRALERLDNSDTWGAVSFGAILLAEGGPTLRSLAPQLPYHDIHNATTRFLGTGLWDDVSLWTEDALQGGWFAAPPPDSRARFKALFQQIFGYVPPRIASLGYDGMTLAAALSDAEPGQRFTLDRLRNPYGFAGIDGIFRFRRNGVIDRGLAVLEIEDGKVKVVSPAPTRFDTAPQAGFDRPGS